MENNQKLFFDRAIWKEVELPATHSRNYKILVSNYGDVKRITLKSGVEKIMTQSKTEGYPAVNLRIMEPLTANQITDFDEMRSHLKNLEIKIRDFKVKVVDADSNMDSCVLEALELELVKYKKKYSRKYKKCENSRKKNWGNLTHRLVAIAFVNKATENHNLVAHLDYNKENNHFSNLKWMTRAENIVHQKSSPFVIQSKTEVLEKGGHRSNTKLTEKQVMIIKKRINEGVSLRDLAKRNIVTETQLLRIKRGVNWGKVPAAL